MGPPPVTFELKVREQNQLLGHVSSKSADPHLNEPLNEGY